MADIYNISKEDGSITQIPSIQYVDDLIKQLEDKLIEHINNSNNAHDALSKIQTSIINETTEIKELPTNTPIEGKVLAKEIIQDENHRFISEAFIRILKDKPSLKETLIRLQEIEDKMNQKIDDKFDSLLNMPDIVNKVRNLIILLEENNNLTTLLEVLSSRVDSTQFQNHIKSDLHMTINDRRALNILIDFVKNGAQVDWNASEGVIAIKNKPDALPASGGNAEKVCGYTIDKLITKRIYTYIFGCEGHGYSKCDVDYFCKDNGTNKTEENYITNWLIKNSNKYSTKILFRAGNYTNSFDYTERKFEQNDLCIEGDYNNTIFKNGNNIFSYIHLKNFKMQNSTIVFTNNCDANNVYFKDCEITLDNSHYNIIKNCRFEGCKFNFIGNISECIITENYFIQCDIIDVLPDTNIYKYNIKL